MDEAKSTGMKPKWWSRPHRSPDAEQDSAPDPEAESAEPVADRPSPKPLHGEDPYGTPPYGGPGPWAPAPPVQHPRATPPHGVQLPQASPTAAPHPAPQRRQQPQPQQPRPQQPQAQPQQPQTQPQQPQAQPQQTQPQAAPHPAPQPQAIPQPAPQPQQPVPRYDPWGTYAAMPLGPDGPAAGSAGERRPGRKRLVAGALVLVLLAGVAGGLVGAYLERNGGVGEVRLPQADGEDDGRPADSIAGIAAATLPGVVTLHVRGGGAKGTGTGFVLDKRGHILTNQHVVDPAGDDGAVEVTFRGGESATGRVVGGDSGYDLAVVKVENVAGLKPLPLGNSDAVQVGDPVVAIGSPFDLAGTVTTGIISAKGRPITAGGEGDGSDVSYVDALQTDAPINPGNSGGPLVDAKGRVVGINSAMRAADRGTGAPDEGQGGSIGLGFAIPVNQGKRVAEELINTGEATHPVIGVSVDMSYGGDGAQVGTSGGSGPSVVPDGPADKAGIKEGDIITAVDGARVRTGEELIVKIRSHRPGDQLELTVERDGAERSVEVTLGTASGG